MLWLGSFTIVLRKENVKQSSEGWNSEVVSQRRKLGPIDFLAVKIMPKDMIRIETYCFEYAYVYLRLMKPWWQTATWYNAMRKNRPSSARRTNSSNEREVGQSVDESPGTSEQTIESRSLGGISWPMAHDRPCLSVPGEEPAKEKQKLADSRIIAF